MGAQTLNILLVDDSDDDAFLMRHALERGHLRGTVLHVCSVREAIAFLKGDEKFSDRAAYPFPDMLITDLHMPGGTGFDLLLWLRSHPECAVIPSLVFSSSGLPGDVSKAYQLGANAFMIKPVGLHELTRVLLTAHHFWSLCERPPRPPHEPCT